MADIYGPIGQAANIVGQAISNAQTQAYTRENMKAAYNYNESAADNADRRTRALYNDLYSIPAMMEQLKKAGLSPSIYSGMAGGGGSGGGQAGAQGGGASGAVPGNANTYRIDPTMMAQIENIKADAELKKAQADEIRGDTPLSQAKTNNLEAATNLLIQNEKNERVKHRIYKAEAGIIEVDERIKQATEDVTIESLWTDYRIKLKNEDILFQEWLKKSSETRVQQATEQTQIAQISQNFLNSLEEYKAIQAKTKLDDNQAKLIAKQIEQWDITHKNGEVVVKNSKGESVTIKGLYDVEKLAELTIEAAKAEGELTVTGKDEMKFVSGLIQSAIMLGIMAVKAVK